MRQQRTHRVDALTIGAIAGPVVALSVLAVDAYLVATKSNGVASLTSVNFPWMLIVVPLTVLVGLLIGFGAPPIVSLLVILIAIAEERFQQPLLPQGGINLRLDELLAPSITLGFIIREWRDREWLREGLLRDLARIPGLTPLGFFLLANLVPTALIMQDHARGASLYIILLGGVACYVGVALLVARVSSVREVVAPLVMIGVLEAFFGLGALALSAWQGQPVGFGVQVDPVTHIVEPYGTMVEANFFGQYLAALLLVVIVFIVDRVTRGQLRSRTTLLLALVAILVAAGMLASETRAAWLGLAAGVIVIVVLWPLRGMETGLSGSIQQRRINRWLPALSVVALLVVSTSAFLLLGGSNTAVGQRFASLFDFSTGSGKGRLRVLQLILQDLSNPILGMGDGSFNHSLPPFPGQPPEAPWIYSMFLAVFHDSGIIGLTLWLAFLVVLYAGLVRVVRGRFPHSMQALALAMIAVLTCLLIAGQATTGMYLIFFWAFLGLGAGVPLLAASRAVDDSVVDASVEDQDSLALAIAGVGVAAGSMWRRLAAAIRVDDRPAVSAVLANQVRAISTDNRSTGRRGDVSRPFPRGYFAVALLVLACLVAVLYGRTVTNNFAADEWAFLGYAASGPGTFLGPTGSHFNPVTLALTYVMYALFGLNPLPYHALALLLFWTCSAVVLALAWQLTHNFTISALAAVLFTTFGTQYEAIIWGADTYFQSIGFLLYMGGLLLYIRWCSAARATRQGVWAYIGFLGCLVLAPLAYEQEVTLIAACALYRLAVVEYRWGFSRVALLARAKGWTRDFAVPAVLFALYLVLKLQLAKSTGSTQTPGLDIATNYGIGYLAGSTSQGVLFSVLPGVGIEPLIAARVSLLNLLWDRQWRGFVAIGVASAVLLWIAKPLYRFLGLWIVVLIVSMVVGIGGLSSRYLLLIDAPVCIIWAGLLYALYQRLRTWIGPRLVHLKLDVADRWASGVGIAVAGAIALLFIVSGSQFALIQTDTWVTASSQMGTIYAQIQDAVEAEPQSTTLYLLNLPDCLQAPTGKYECAYMFRNAADHMVELRMPGRFQRVQAIYTRTDVYMTGQYVTSQDLSGLYQTPGMLILQYDWHTGAISQWTPGGAGLG